MGKKSGKRESALIAAVTATDDARLEIRRTPKL